MVMLKGLKQYYSATDDDRVVPFMSKYFQYQLQALNGCPIGKWTEWAQSRGAENVMMAQWLHGITGEEHLIELAALIESQSFQWSDWFGGRDRSEEHTSELQSLMRISYAVFCLKKQNILSVT